MNIEQTEVRVYAKQLSWAAVIAGGLVGVGLSVLFHLLSSGIGLATFTRTETGVNTLIMAGLVWLVVGGYIILFIAGYVAGKLAEERCIHTTHGALHGFLAWTLAIIILTAISLPFYQSTALSMHHVTQSINEVSNQSMSATSNQAIVADKPTEKVINKAGLATLAAFLVILASALGATMGGWYAVKSTRLAKL